MCDREQLCMFARALVSTHLKYIDRPARENSPAPGIKLGLIEVGSACAPCLGRRYVTNVWRRPGLLSPCCS